MFKKIITAVMCSSLVFTSLPGYSAPFGKSSSGSSSSSKSTSSSYSSQSRSNSSSSNSGSSSRSYSNFGSSSKSTSTAPSQSNQQQQAQSSSLGKGQSIGMSRSSVAQSVRDGTNKAPANNTTVAGSNPSGSRNYTAPSYTAPSYNRNYERRYDNTYSASPSYQQPRQGYGMGTVIGAAAAGALVGYLLHRDNSGNVYYTNPAQPGIAYDANGNRLGSVPYGNYQTMGTVNSNGTLDTSSVGTMSNNAALGAPVQQASPTSSSSGFGWFLVVLLVLAALGAFVYFVFIRRPQTTTEKVYTPMNTDYRNPEEKLRDEAREMFVNFQKNNRPSQMSYIQSNSDPIFFDAIKDTVMESSDSREVKVKSVEAELVDLTQEGTKYIGSVHYRATLEENDNGNVTQTAVDQMWNYIYNGSKWVLAGIDIINDDQVNVVSNSGSEFDFNKPQDDTPHSKYQR